MRQNSNSGRRLRGRPSRNKQHGGPPNRNSNFDSNGPEGKVRGNAAQVYEKYLGLAREATVSGNRVAAEGFFQHAEHYYRIINDSTDPRPVSSPGQGGHAARDGQHPPRQNGADGEGQRRSYAGDEAGIATEPGVPDSAAAGAVSPNAEEAPEGVAQRARAPQERAPEPKNSEVTAPPAAPSAEQNRPADSATNANPQEPQATTAEGPGADGAAVDEQSKAAPSERPRRGRPRKAAGELKDEGERPRRGRPRKVKPAEAEEPVAAAKKSEKSSDTAA